MASAKRDLLVSTALELFNRQGYRATGIDKILSESGVAKMTLYNHFNSKDELIIAALSKRDEEFSSYLRKSITRLIGQQREDPRLAKLMAFFDALDEWFNSDTFWGCNFINASIEFKRKDDPIHAAAAAHKKLVIQMLQEFLAELHLEDTYHVARQIHILVEGSIVMAVSLDDKSAAKLAKEMAIKLLRSYSITPSLLSV